MITMTEITTAIAQVGLPVGLIVWGIWFLSAKVWPWIADADRRALDRAIEQGKSNALIALAQAIEHLSTVIKDSSKPQP